uniref:Uncharacterized protein n=1 Tax=Tanacetum cinerariifolium TaxID=118510 RepID=A0A6L2LEA6_TANCI|nr:hypothetical protein [Tanacetum cinerariifolium]
MRDHTFYGSDDEDANKHIKRVLDIVDLCTTPDVTINQIMLCVFPITLTGAASRWLRNEPAADAKKAIQEMVDYSKKWHDGTSTRNKISNTFDGLVAIQAQLNNLDKEIKKENERVYASQVGCELCNGPHYSKDSSLKEEGKTLEEAYYTQFEVPFLQARRYKVASSGFYQRDNRHTSYQERRQTMEESLNTFMVESVKRHDEHSSLIKEIRASTNAAIRIQGALIKALEIQTGQMSKVLQERGSESLPSSTETKLKDHVKSITTTDEAKTLKEEDKISQDPEYGDFIKLNYLNEPLELRNHKMEDLDLKIEEGEVIDEPMVDVVKIRNDDEIIEEIDEYLKKIKYKGKNIVGAFINMPIFVGNFSIVTNIKAVKNMDAYRDKDMGDVIFGKPFFRVVCVEARRFDGFITIHGDNDSVTYQMAQSHLRFKHLSNKKCNKIRPLLQVSTRDNLEGNLHPYQKLKGFFKEVLNLGPEYRKDEKMVEWLTHGHVSIHEMD